MKNIKYTIFTLVILFISIFHVNAYCTNEEITSLKELADDIKVTYKHLGKVEDEEGTYHYNNFEVNVKNISDDLYILTLGNTIKLIPESEIIKTTLSSGNWNFNVYSNKCEEKIKEIKVFIPKFNEYSLDPLCEGIDGDDFALCGKYYEYDVSYENFKSRVEQYRANHNINYENNKEERNQITLIIQKILNFIETYQLYITLSLIIILLIIIVIIIIKRKNKRGVLE